MNLIPVETPEDFLLARQFILPHEETCVSLASLVRRKSNNLIFISSSNHEALHVPTSSDNLLGIIDLDHTIYHCIPDTRKVDVKEFTQKLNDFIQKPVRCISGQTEGTDFFIQTLALINKSTPIQQNPYKMMQYQPQGMGESFETTQQLNISEEIIRCTEKDMDLLSPLQKGFIKEEISLPGHKITDAEVSIMLRQILKNQLCLAMLSDGEAVAKANTNAIGFKCVQIGGVYTHPLYRRNGYAAALIKTLCKRALRANRTPVLFVKEKNTPALTLYQKIGFTECGGYKIVYY